MHFSVKNKNSTSMALNGSIIVAGTLIHWQKS